MKRVVGFFLLLVMALPVFAVEDGQVMYAGGTVPAMKEGAVGKLDMTSQIELTFESAGSKMAIPFAKIDSYEYSQEVARHLGVLPAIGVGLLKRRQRKHFFRISYSGEGDTAQVAVFEVPKQMPSTLLAVLQARAPQGCKPRPNAKCSQGN